jgi:hypothetical protein
MGLIKGVLIVLRDAIRPYLPHKTQSPTPTAPPPARADALEPVIIELIVGAEEEEMVMEIAVGLEETGLILDHSYLPVPLRSRRYEGMGPDDRVYVVRGEIEKRKIVELKARDEVGHVWIDAPVQAFGKSDDLLF